MFDEILDRREVLGAIGAVSGFALLMEQPASAAAEALSTLMFDGFSPRGRELVTAILTSPRFQGRIAKEDAEQLEKAEGKSKGEIMLALLAAAQLFSLPPVSNYRVGVVVSGASGSLYLGANLEPAGQPLGAAVHAEQSACSGAYAHGESAIRSLAVTGAPCGHCRQFLEELSPAGDLEILVKGKEPVALKSLLPAAFSPRDLGVARGALPPTRAAIALHEHTDANHEGVKKALEAASLSWAPYSKARSGVALTMDDGAVVSGSYIENVAFNPSLPPLQAALVAMVKARKSYAQIREATLVEVDEAVISQRAMTETVLAAIAPKVRLRRVTGRLEG